MDPHRQDDERTRARKAVYILVDDIEPQRIDEHGRTLGRDLLRSKYLQIRQLLIQGLGPAGVYGFEAVDRMLYVLDGEALLRQGGKDTEVGPGHLMVFPHGAPLDSRLFVKSDRLTLLEIVPRSDRKEETLPSGDPPSEPTRVIKPDDVPPYPPAGHAKTVNRCLFQNEQVEIIQGSIEVGGGADEHLHPEHEQVLYVLEGSERPLLIYYPKGTPHGTGGGTSVPLKLLVIYSPPLGEARSVLT